MNLRDLLYDQLEQKVILEAAAPVATEAERKRRNWMKETFLGALHALRAKDSEDLDAQATAYMKTFLMIACLQQDDLDALRETMLPLFRKGLDAMIDHMKAAQQFAKRMTAGEKG